MTVVVCWSSSCAARTLLATAESEGWHTVVDGDRKARMICPRCAHQEGIES